MALTNKQVKDIIRLEVAALCELAKAEKSSFAKDILAKCTPAQKSIVKQELGQVAEMMRTKAAAVDEA